jgi:hypothetical protein
MTRMTSSRVSMSHLFAMLASVRHLP